MIELDTVSVRRGSTLVLDRVTLALDVEVVALVGPSGSGKSTLLRAILGLESLCSGAVRIGGRLAADSARVLMDPSERNVAMVFQDLALWPHLSVAGNLSFGLRARCVPKVERARRIVAALGSLGLESKASRLPGELSGGERQRVAIARALVLDPVAILLDEPLGSLDVMLKAELLQLLVGALRARRLPAIYVTHDPVEARAMADRIAILEHGHLTQLTSVDSLIAAPATEFAAAFARGLGRTD